MPIPDPATAHVGKASLLAWPFILLIRVYQVTLSPLMGGQCRFVPSCSCYGVDAYRIHGPIRGTVLTARRILRCNPFVKGGYDPVPLPGGLKKDPAGVTPGR